MAGGRLNAVSLRDLDTTVMIGVGRDHRTEGNRVAVAVVAACWTNRVLVAAAARQMGIREGVSR